MIVLFDAYLEHPELREIVKRDVELSNLFKGIVAFIFERLAPLRDLIDAEEKEEDKYSDRSRCILVFVLDNNPKGISFESYSDDLLKKMRLCFSEMDIKFFLKKQVEFRQMRNN